MIIYIILTLDSNSQANDTSQLKKVPFSISINSNYNFLTLESFDK